MRALWRDGCAQGNTVLTTLPDMNQLVTTGAITITGCNTAGLVISGFRSLRTAAALAINVSGMSAVPACPGSRCARLVHDSLTLVVPCCVLAQTNDGLQAITGFTNLTTITTFQLQTNGMLTSAAVRPSCLVVLLCPHVLSDCRCGCPACLSFLCVSVWLSVDHSDPTCSGQLILACAWLCLQGFRAISSCTSISITGCPLLQTLPDMTPLQTLSGAFSITGECGMRHASCVCLKHPACKRLPAASPVCLLGVHFIPALFLTMDVCMQA